MSLAIHRPYPGVALVVTDRGSVLLSAPADAFKATKKYCADHKLPFPRELVATQSLLVDAAPQFNPEFFLYDFLFVYGAAFKPDLADERLKLLVDKDQVRGAEDALRITLNGPSREELQSYAHADGSPILTKKEVNRLATVAENMAIKKGDKPRELHDSISTVTFDAKGVVDALDGDVKIQRTGPMSFKVSKGKKSEHVDLTINEPVVPFCTLPVPKEQNRPLTFGVKALGTRNGFDLSGPTTGFVIWVNGRAVIYDGPVGTRYLLESQGISPEDVEIVVLSHCHEDHMGAFVELFLAGYRPKVLTAEPIYQSALIKLAGFFGKKPHEVAHYIDYRRVTPGKPVYELGARFDFFYAVHSIPTVGLKVSMKDHNGVTHAAQISGDTMHHEGLDTMFADGVINKETYKELRELVPNKKVDNATYFADVGEAIIHGHPKDWAENPNNMVYYHCSDNDHTRSFGVELAAPGQIFSMVEPRQMHPATPGRLLRALQFLELDDPGWFQNILYQGTSRSVKTGETLVKAGKGTRKNDVFTVVVTGSASVSDADGNEVATLRPGEFYGVIELVDREGCHTATVKALTPMEIFEIDAAVFHDYIQKNGLEPMIEKIWTSRPMVESAKIFRSLDTAVRNNLAKVAMHETFKKGEQLIVEGSQKDDFYVLVKGTVSVQVGDNEVATIKHSQDDNFFGEVAALSPNRRRNASIYAKSAKVEVLRIKGNALRKIVQGHTGIRYTLTVAIEKRGGKVRLPRIRETADA